MAVIFMDLESLPTQVVVLVAFVKHVSELSLWRCIYRRKGL